MLVSFPAFAQRVTVLGSTRNKVATSPGVIRCSVSGIELTREVGALMVAALLAATPNCRAPVGFMSAMPPFFVSLCYFINRIHVQGLRNFKCQS